VKILVVGNPANTNALIAQSSAPDVPKERFTAMTRLDQNRAYTQLAQKLGKSVTDIKKLAVWGNHSPTMYPNLFHAEVDGQNAAEAVNDQSWIEDTFLPTVGKRGAAIIDARGASSAASAANAAIDHVYDWVNGTNGGWVSMAVPSSGEYGVEEGIISSFPVTTENGEWKIVEGLEIDEFSQSKIDATVDELKGERDTVKDLGLI
jgi:malate dehydrogenase